jgi:hypothetical protein
VYSSLAFGEGVDVMRMIDFRELATTLAVVITAVTIGIIASTKKKSHNFTSMLTI